MATLAVVNQKGGSAKTTTTVHLAYAAAEAGKRVLLVDMDKQGSASLSFPRPEGVEAGLTASHLFSAEAPSAKPENCAPNIDIIRADDRLAQLTATTPEALKRPAANLRRLLPDYDVCLIDTPGAIGFNPPMTISALVAADAVICPFSVGLYEGDALRDLREYLAKVTKGGYNPRLKMLGLLPSKVKTTSKRERDALEGLRATMGKSILGLTLADRQPVKYAIDERRPVWRGARTNSERMAAKEWRHACETILAQLGK